MTAADKASVLLLLLTPYIIAAIYLLRTA